MALFDDKSRYASVAPTYAVDRRGRVVEIVPPPERPVQALAGYHLRRQGERLDHLAAHYLGDPAGYWRIAEANDAMLPDALAEAREVAIPGKPR